MPVESWTRPEDVPALAAQARVQIDAALSRLDAAGREAFWSSITKCYNTPYNDPKPRPLERAEVVVAAGQGPVSDEATLASDLASLVAISHPAAFGPEHHPA